MKFKVIQTFLQTLADTFTWRGSSLFLTCVSCEMRVVTLPQSPGNVSQKICLKLVETTLDVNYIKV